MRRLLVFLSCFLFAAPLLAAQAERIGAAEIDRSDRYLIESTAVGDTFRIDVILPIGYGQGEKRYPVVYVTDSNYLLPSAAATLLAQARGEYPPMIIVGVGWDVPSIARMRTRDLTPTCSERFKSERSFGDDECGHADAFAAFLAEELQPFVNRTYQTSGDDTLVGYSFGGLFGLHVLFHHTDLFDRYVLGSASIEWDSEVLFRSEAAYASSNDDLAKTVYLSVGSEEADGTIPRNYRMAEQLRARNYPGLRLEMEVLDGETHLTSINAFVMRGLRSVLVGEKPR